MGELLLDSAAQASNAESASESVKKEDKALYRCQRHLFKCLEHKFQSEFGEVEASASSFLTEEYMARLYWALGKMHLIEGRCSEAEHALETALHHTSSLSGPVVLKHLQKDAVISTETIEAKLATCLYHNLIDGLLEDGMNGDIFQYKNACTLLMPILFPSKREKSSVLTTEYRIKGLSYLKVHQISTACLWCEIVLLESIE